VTDALIVHLAAALRSGDDELATPACAGLSRIAARLPSGECFSRGLWDALAVPAAGPGTFAAKCHALHGLARIVATADAGEVASVGDCFLEALGGFADVSGEILEAVAPALVRLGSVAVLDGRYGWIEKMATNQIVEYMWKASGEVPGAVELLAQMEEFM
jgi:hypothetical protein